MLIKRFSFGALKNFCYLIGCEETGEALLIDPGGDLNKIIDEAKKNNLEIRTIFNTHDHYDHTDANQELKELTGAKVVMHKPDADHNATVDVKIDKEEELKVGNIAFKIIHTPGHTPGGACLYGHGQLFTGDTLFVGDSGRTDLAGGDRPTLGASIREKLMTLPDDTVIRPGHDLGPTQTSTIAWEKRNNVNAKEYGYYVSDDD